MTDSAALRNKIKESGFLYKYIAQKLGLSYYGFMKKVDYHSEFKASEIAALSDILKLSDAERINIFLPHNVIDNHVMRRAQIMQ